MKFCIQCMTPETHESIMFDEKGVCNICRQIKYKQEQIDWHERKTTFHKVADTIRGKHTYDCIAAFSGGKDSSFIVHSLVKEFNLKPLVVSFNHGFFRQNNRENARRVLEKLGVDYIEYKPSGKLLRAVMKEALLRKGDFCWHCHVGVSTFPLHMAIKFGVPLIMYGEPPSEYSSYRGYEDVFENDEQMFHMLANLGITAEDMLGMVDGFSIRDFEMLCYPSREQIIKAKVKSFFLGHFVPWDVKSQVETLQKEYGWKLDKIEGVPPEYGYEKNECVLQGARDYLKFIKRGYARTSHLTSIDIRNNRMTRDQAEKLFKEYDGKRPRCLRILLELLDMTEEEFMKIALTHQVAPYKHAPSKTIDADPVSDIDNWKVYK